MGELHEGEKRAWLRQAGNEMETNWGGPFLPKRGSPGDEQTRSAQRFDSRGSAPVRWRCGSARRECGAPMLPSEQQSSYSPRRSSIARCRSSIMKGFGTVGVPALSRNARVEGLRVSPVVKITRFASSGCALLTFW